MKPGSFMEWHLTALLHLPIPNLGTYFKGFIPRGSRLTPENYKWIHPQYHKSLVQGHSVGVRQAQPMGRRVYVGRVWVMDVHTNLFVKVVHEGWFGDVDSSSLEPVV